MLKGNRKEGKVRPNQYYKIKYRDKLKPSNQMLYNKGPKLHGEKLFCIKISLC